MIFTIISSIFFCFMLIDSVSPSDFETLSLSVLWKYQMSSRMVRDYQGDKNIELDLVHSLRFLKVEST